MARKKRRKKPGPKPQRVKIEGDWRAVIGQALRMKPPKKDKA